MFNPRHPSHCFPTALLRPRLQKRWFATGDPRCPLVSIWFAAVDSQLDEPPLLRPVPDRLHSGTGHLSAVYNDSGNSTERFPLRLAA
jgi:hypothetical protein